MTILETPHRYFPQANLPTQWCADCFGFDQRKLNLLWLVCPEVDALWDKPMEMSAVQESINEFYCIELIDGLILPPLDFMRQWIKMRPWELEITRHWPANHTATMWCRAHVAAARMCTCEGNVICVNFSQRSRAA